MNNFSSILDFAIERELEAVEFYRNLAEQVKQPASVVFLKELESMEQEHAKALRIFLEPENESGIKPPAVTDLKISDFMEDIEPRDEMSYQEVILIAIKREEASKNLYQALSDRSEGLVASTLFKRLAEEELRHKKILETMYDDEILVEN